ncbi:hypothetical protein BaRGS_00015261 [Batillaria attramentaria]|uniref:Uncharacterized protein n=1 Tax=Batillaria attramentaria TaxID=370345 RepID=A0ABD0L264_9CAEN
MRLIHVSVCVGSRNKTVSYPKETVKEQEEANWSYRGYRPATSVSPKLIPVLFLFFPRCCRKGGRAIGDLSPLVILHNSHAIATHRSSVVRTMRAIANTVSRLPQNGPTGMRHRGSFCFSRR